MILLMTLKLYEKLHFYSNGPLYNISSDHSRYTKTLKNVPAEVNIHCMIRQSFSNYQPSSNKIFCLSLLLSIIYYWSLSIYSVFISVVVNIIKSYVHICFIFMYLHTHKLLWRNLNYIKKNIHVMKIYIKGRLN